ncbi:hypothetical protein HDU99_008072, partial [Rhizoclosmatium hyalinum]
MQPPEVPGHWDALLSTLTREQRLRLAQIALSGRITSNEAVVASGVGESWIVQSQPPAPAIPQQQLLEQRDGYNVLNSHSITSIDETGMSAAEPRTQPKDSHETICDASFEYAFQNARIHSGSINSAYDSNGLHTDHSRPIPSI